ncbi:TPA: GntR family transcriptional regulator [Clostridium perfringens]|nr:GntR family transcriptional regulator [Clostridium perfringens]
MEILTVNKPKELLYVTVYDKLFKMINEGTFPENSRLPSEPELAKRLGISRSTLRQALALLQDDGLIRNIRGKGNYIIKENKTDTTGLEKIGHPVYKCLDLETNDVELDFKIEPPSDYYKKILGDKSVATVCVDRWYLNKNSTLAYTYTIIAIEAISKFNIDLSDKSSILKFVEEESYKDCSKIKSTIKFTTAGNFVTKDHPIPNEKQFYLIDEAIYSDSEFPIIFNKHYLPIKHSTIKINPNR